MIIGGGPAGLAAGLYASRARLETLLIEKGIPGGQVLITDWIDNYPGFVNGISGSELMEKMIAHVNRFGLEQKNGTVSSLELTNHIKKLYLDNGEVVTAGTVIICTGGSPGKLGIPGEKELAGRGVSYCATCDGPFYTDQEIAVIGGGNTALQEAVHLTKFARKVTVIHRREELRATRIIQEKARANDRIDFILNARATEITGDENGVTGIRLHHNDGSRSELPVSGVFVLIGVVPNNAMLPLDELDTDGYGFLITDSEMRTRLPGVFAAGDIRSKIFRQIITAVGEGVTAVLSAEHYLATLK